MAKILSEKKSTAGSPYVYYNVWATEVEDSRQADSVDLYIQMNGHLASASSILGSGSSYTLTGYLEIEGTEYSLPLKGKNDSWSGTTTHSSNIKTITISNIEPSAEALENIKFRVARGNGSTSSAGYLASTSCSDIPISIGHIAPSNVQMAMVETNPLLVSAGVLDNLLVEYLSQKRLTFTYELHDDAVMEKVGVFNNAKSYSNTTNPFTLDLTQVTLEKDANDNTKIPLTPYVQDSYGRGFGILTKYSYIPYKPITITETLTNAKRLGQTSGRVGISANGIYYNGEVGNINQTSYKPVIKYKFWEAGGTEPSTYDYTIPSENITIDNGTFSVSNYDIGSSTETDINFFNPENAYRIKLQISDNFTYTESNELQIQVGEAVWNEYKDRLDAKKFSISNNIVEDFVVEKGGTYATNYYIKYNSGIMIQYGRFAVTSALQTELGNVYRTSSTIGIDFVESFIDTNYTITTSANSAINSFYINPSDKTASSFKGYAIAYTSTASATRYIDFIAIGRWK